MHSILCRNPKIKIGDKFNRLTAIGPEFKLKQFTSGAWRIEYAVVCRCECGNVTAPLRDNVIKGHTKSCGCLAVEAGKRTVIHGGHGTPIYDAWRKMNARCYDKKHRAYKNYGARGITVCDEWRADFVAFREWAIRNGYDESLTIDRKENNGNYEPDNCRFTTYKENNNNRRVCVFVTWEGETKTLKQWSEDIRCVVTYETLHRRFREGWKFGTAMSAPTQKKKRALLA